MPAPELTTACPVCAQQPGEPCVWAKPMPHPLFHVERGDMAASNRDLSSHETVEISHDQFDLAVERLGLL